MECNMEDKKLWYGEGLRFACTGCGRCCRGEPGYVWLAPGDMSRLCEFLKINRTNLLLRYCREVGGRISLLEYDNGDCVFYAHPGCRVYPARPDQCRTFPFWPHILQSRGTWEAEKRRCPGIGRGTRHSRAQVLATLRVMDGE